MIEQKLQNYFKQFTAITPRADFAARSRATIMLTQQEAISPRLSFILRIKETLTTGGALALASFLLLIILSGISYVAKQGGQVARTGGLSDDALVREASQLSFQVQLKEAEYFDESASQVARALDRLSGGAQ